MKQPSQTPSPHQLWQPSQSRAKKLAKKTRKPFRLWLLPSENTLRFPSPKTNTTVDELHRAFREELLS
jgi:hypothetical protein